MILGIVLRTPKLNVRTRLAYRYSHGIAGGPWELWDDVGRAPAEKLRLLLSDAKGNRTAPENPPAFRPGQPVPPGYHFIYFNPAFQDSSLGSDGYDNYQAPRTDSGYFRRRMWTGGELNFSLETPLVFNRDQTCEEQVCRNRLLRGNCHVGIERVFRRDGRVALKELRYLVYTNANPSLTDASNPLSPGRPAETELECRLSPTMLFRYSALTYNAHRIHYDKQYAQEAEGHRDILVHGPLTVSLLLSWFGDLKPELKVRRFRYRNVKSAYVGTPLTLSCRAAPHGFSLEVRDELGAVCVESQLECFAE